MSTLSKPESARIKRILNQLRKVHAPLSQAQADCWPERFHQERGNIQTAISRTQATIHSLEALLDPGTVSEEDEPEHDVDLEKIPAIRERTRP